jgi:hypothetical protein
VAGTRLAAEQAVLRGGETTALSKTAVAGSDAAPGSTRWEVVDGAVAAADGVTGTAEGPVEAAEIVGCCVARLAEGATLRTAGRREGARRTAAL